MSNTSAECATPAPTNAPVSEPVSAAALATLLVGFVGLATTFTDGVFVGAAFVVFALAGNFSKQQLHTINHLTNFFQFN